MRFNFAFLTSVVFLLVLAILDSRAAILQRNARDVDLLAEERKDQIPVAVIEVQEPDTVVQSLQVDTAIQTTFDSSAAENEQENEFKEIVSTEAAEDAFVTNKFEADVEVATETKLEEFKALTSAPIIPEQTALNSQDQLAEPTEIVAEKENLNIVPVTEDADVDPLGRQNVPNAESTTQQNFVQFIQNTPIGQFFTQLTGGQQQQQQQGSSPAVAGAASDTPQTTPQAPGFLNPGVALTQAQQAVQNAAQSVVNTTTQAFQGLQQFASNIGTQFQSTISSLSGQNQQNSGVQQDATSARPPGPIQAIVSNFVGGNGASTSRPGQAQGPFQGIISFFQGGQRPQTNNAQNPAQNQAAAAGSNNNIVSNDTPSADVDDKIETQEAEITNEVRNSEETLDSFEESQSGQDLIVVNDDASLVTEQTKAV